MLSYKQGGRFNPIRFKSYNVKCFQATELASQMLLLGENEEIRVCTTRKMRRDAFTAISFHKAKQTIVACHFIEPHWFDK